eukprot:630076-Pyramimonas_sp.AAC.1
MGSRVPVEDFVLCCTLARHRISGGTDVSAPGRDIGAFLSPRPDPHRPAGQDGPRGGAPTSSGRALDGAE